MTTEKSGARIGLAQSATEYLKDVRVEVSKVTWPSREELRESTLVVIVMVFVIAVFIGIVDRGFSYAFEALVRLLG